MLAPLRRCVDGWPCMVGDLRGRKMRTGSKIENPSTSRYAESRELQLLLFNFLCDVNRAPYKWSAEKWVTSPAPTLYVSEACGAPVADILGIFLSKRITCGAR